MNLVPSNMPEPASEPLLDRVVTILEQARGNVVRAVNTQMVWAYWLIGREIVQALQGGEERAAYGQQMLLEVSKQLTQRYGKGFSVPNLQNFRKFYLAYSTRVIGAVPIQYPAGTKSGGGQIQYPAGDELADPSALGFSPQLTWSHYRALMRVDNMQARDFYEREAIECGWSKVQLERQIHSFYFERIVANRGVQGLLPTGRERLPGEPVQASQVLKSPMVLEFLGLPDTPSLHESKLEQAIIDNLQTFLGKLTHADIGQMDGYVRLFEDQFKVPGDNPTIGLLLCSDKGEAVAKYSILHESKQIFASKYTLCLPTEEQLRREVERERQLIEAALEDLPDT